MDRKNEKMYKAVGPAPIVTVTHSHGECKGLIDTGASVNIIRSGYYQTFVEPFVKFNDKEFATHFVIRGVDMKQVKVVGYVELSITFMGFRLPNCPFIIMDDGAPVLASKNKTSMVIGTSALKLCAQRISKREGADLWAGPDCVEGVDPALLALLRFYNTVISGGVQQAAVSVEADQTASRAMPCGEGLHDDDGEERVETTSKEEAEAPPSKSKKGFDVEFKDIQGKEIPPYSACCVMGHLKKRVRGKFVVDRREENELPEGVAVNYSFVNLKRKNKVQVLLVNTTNEPKKLEAPSKIAKLCACREVPLECDTKYEATEDSDVIEVTCQEVYPEYIKEELLTSDPAMGGLKNVLKQMSNP